MGEKRFEITGDHLKLLQRAYVSWDDCEFGAPEIDCKRPYGNSNVYGDIAEILGRRVPDYDNDEEWTQQETNAMDEIHREMAIVLEIGFQLLKFETGVYERIDWKRWQPMTTA